MNLKHFTFFLMILTALAFSTRFEASAAVYKTKNFVVHTSDPDLAREFALTAEYQRRKQAIDWLGAPLRDWAKPCQVKVTVGENLAPGGATTFVFANGEVFDWDMNIQGSVERIIDSVIPHEVTHTIFACRFRQPVPRWVDEGAATSVEHISERTKYRRMLIGFLQTNRGISFRTMVSAKEYPQDAMPFYAQSFTAAEYLIARGGRKRYIAFVERGIQTNDWNGALKQFYGYENVSHFQNVWLAWVRNQFPAIDNDLMREDVRIASNNPYSTQASDDQYARVARPEPNLLLRTPVSTAHPNAVLAASYNETVNNQTVAAPRPVSQVAAYTEPMPQPSGAWNEMSTSSYNEIAPASYNEAAPAYSGVSPAADYQAPPVRLNWLPGNAIPPHADQLNNRR